MLNIRQLNTGYGALHVLYDITLRVQPGERVALIGPNGSGKSTVLKAVSGVIETWSGSVHLGRQDITRQKPVKTIAQGLTYCPQGSRIFGELSVRENLEIGGFHLTKDMRNERIEAVLEAFPVLRAKLKKGAGTLSGGEQQMLALGRALVPKPKMLLLDEPSLGLAPKVIHQVFDKLVEINVSQGVSLLIVEQKVKAVLGITQRVYALRLGRTVHEGDSEKLLNSPDRLKEIFLS